MENSEDKGKSPPLSPSSETGTVTIPGHPSDELKRKTWGDIKRQAGIREEQR